MTMTFKDFLKEFTTDTTAMDDPDLKAKLLRRMRTQSPEQQDRMDTRMQRDQIRAQRKDLQGEHDPRLKGLRRKKLALQRQLDMINDQLAGGDEGGEEGMGDEIA